jgi:DNA-binding beta-propeller fold protein YncE
MSDKRIIHMMLSGSVPLSGSGFIAGPIFKQLGYVPTGIAVDPARNRVYVSDFSDNQIQVLNMQTAALEAVVK